MDIVALLRTLWRCRVAVAVGLAPAALITILWLGGHRSSVGIASSEVYIDSKSSQDISLGGAKGPADISALINRAQLLANLIATSPLKDQIAGRAGIAPSAFVATAPSLGSDGPLRKSLDTRLQDPRAAVMEVYFDESLPIITVNTRAPEAQTAARVANAAVTELGSYVTSIEAQERVPDARLLVVKPLGVPRSATVRRGPRRVLALIAGLLVLGLWSLGVVVAAGRVLPARRRRASLAHSTTLS